MIVTPESIRSGKIIEDKRALFIHPEVPDKDIDANVLRWLKDTVITKKVRGKKEVVSKSASWWLKKRAEWDKLAWKRLNGSEFYKFDGSQSRIFLSYYLNGERADAGLDKRGEMVGLTSTTVLIPKPETSADFTLFALAWLNSKVFPVEQEKIILKIMAAIRGAK